jgi:hypothetical protein
MAQQPPAKTKMHPSTIALLAILGLVVVTFGGCMSCVCISASQKHDSHEQPEDP